MTLKIKELDNYFPIKLECLPIGFEVPGEVFIKDEDGEIKTILQRGEHFSLDLKKKLSDRKINVIYVKNQERRIFQDLILQCKSKEYFDSIIDRYVIGNESYFKIEKDCLSPEFPINFSIYLNDGKSLKLLIEATEEDQKNVSQDLNLLDGDFLIAKKDLEQYKKYLLNLLEKTKNEASLLKESTKILIREVYSDPMNRKNLLILGDEIDRIIDYGTLDKDALKKLLIMKKLDNYSYVHAFNVMTLCVALGLKLGLQRDELKLLGLASALHDIGKINISPGILAKLGKLTEREFEIYKTHVSESVKIAKELGLSEKVIEGIAHHHEKLDGSGYPFGLKKEQISLFGQIISITDAYEMLTTPKPMKYPLTPYNALLILVQEKGCYNKNLLEIFIKLLGRLI